LLTRLVDTTNEITIPMAGLAIGQNNQTLKTFVGSCVAICIYDESHKVAGMVHIMLPKNITHKNTKGTKLEGKFADDGIDILLKKLKAIHPCLKLKAKMVGGAKIFNHENDLNTLNIGGKNIDGIRAILKEKNIPLISELIGEKKGRWVTFFCNDQSVLVKNNDGEEII
jgi:chemotaxis protein CheD